MASATASPTSSHANEFRNAEARVRAAYAANQWFLDLYWPENAPRAELMLAEARRAFPNAATTRVLDVGCGNGYMSYLFRVVGYDVTGCDGTAYADRDRLFLDAGIAFFPCNLNDRDPLAGIPLGTYDLVLLGEVIEHILNQPEALLRAIHAVLRPGGMLLLTTPNPSTIMNAWRLLQGRYELWGTDEFLRLPKLVENGQLTTFGDIHYREYEAPRMARLLREIGFQVAATRYCTSGEAPVHSPIKRVLKRTLRATGLTGHRLLGSGYMIVARA